MSATEDELAIRHIVAAYADGVNRRDKDTWEGTWSEDASWELPGRTMQGRQEIVDGWLAAMGSFSFVAQLVYQGTIELDGDVATGRWYLTEHLQPVDSDDTLFSIGTYVDEYVRTSGGWRFQKRSYEILHRK